MEVGGDDYKRIKEEYDQICKKVKETNQNLTKLKSTLENSDAKLTKIEQDRKKTIKDIEKSEKEKERLTVILQEHEA